MSTYLAMTKVPASLILCYNIIMELFKQLFIKKETILALGAESAGVFSVYLNGGIFISENFGDLLDESNFLKYKKAVLGYFPPKADQPRAGQKEKIKPDVVLSDLHPLYKTTIFAEEIAGKYNIPHIKIQHHIAHIFSAVGDQVINNDKTQNNKNCHSERSRSEVKNPVFCAKFTGSFAFAQDDKQKASNTFFGIAMDGTGYGLDGNIWGGEIFRISNDKFQMTNQIQNLKSKIEIKKNNFYIERIGSLEEQIMIGGDLAVKEPARMLIAILAKIPNPPVKYSARRNLTGQANLKAQKDFIYKYVKKFYTRNELEVLYNQLEQNFNCQTTTSTGRVLDAVSVLLGFAGNERRYKHEAARKLEENSSEPYELESRIMNYESRKVLNTTYLFEYLIKNIKRDKKRLAATAQLYIAKGLSEIIKKIPNTKYQIPNTVFAAAGMINNKIIAEYLDKQGIYLSKKIPRGDEGIVVGQIVYYLLNKT